MQGRLSSTSQRYARMRCALSCCTFVIVTLGALAGAPPIWANGPAALVKDINPGPQGFYDASSTDPLTNQMIDVGGKLFFVAIDGTHGLEPWVSDGTAGGTLLVKALGAPSTPDNVPPYNLTLAGDALYFFTGSSGGTTLWRSDGSTNGTVPVTTLTISPSALPARNLMSVNNQLYFLAPDTGEGAELWTSDGTSSGTHILKDIQPGTASSNPAAFVTAGSWVYFAADDGSTGPELWSLDRSIFPDRLPFKGYLPLTRQ